jgi:integrase
VAQARWAEFDLDAGLWTLPAARCKNKREHLIPLGPAAVGLLKELQAVYPGEFLFPLRNVPGATRCWHPSSMGHVCARAARALGLEPFAARDLRRTWKTLAGGVGLGLEIRNRVQNHALQDVGSRHYDRHSYLDEKRAAMQQWERALLARLNECGNVVALRRA